MDSQITFNAVGLPKEKRTHQHGRYIVVFVLILIAGVLCWYIHRPFDPLMLTPGTVWTIQFRRGDVPGAASGLPVPTTVNGAKISLVGTWIAENTDAILLEHTNESSYQTRIWIPKSSILLIQL